MSARRLYCYSTATLERPLQCFRRRFAECRRLSPYAMKASSGRPLLDDLRRSSVPAPISFPRRIAAFTAASAFRPAGVMLSGIEQTKEARRYFAVTQAYLCVDIKKGPSPYSICSPHQAPEGRIAPISFGQSGHRREDASPSRDRQVQRTSSALPQPRAAPFTPTQQHCTAVEGQSRRRGLSVRQVAHLHPFDNAFTLLKKLVRRFSE